VSSASTPGAAPSRTPLVIILTVVGALAIIAAILYVSGASNSMHFMVGSVHKGHHVVRFIVSLVVGVAFLIGAYIARSRPSTSSSSTGSSSTGSSTTGSGTTGSGSTTGGSSTTTGSTTTGSSTTGSPTTSGT
jgi:uncharacterized membrane protein